MLLQLYRRLLDANSCVGFEVKAAFWMGFRRGRSSSLLASPCSPLCACSDCAPVLLIFNGKWLRFLSKPLELGDKNASVAAVCCPVRVHTETSRCGGELLAS